jgi:hypothetical protein
MTRLLRRPPWRVGDYDYENELAFSNVADVLEVKDGELVVKDHAELDRDTLSTIASVEERVNQHGYRSISIPSASEPPAW